MCRYFSFVTGRYISIWQPLAFLIILSIFITVAEQPHTVMDACSLAYRLPLANIRYKLTQMEMCKPQNRIINLLNEGQNTIFTLSLDPTEKSRLVLS